MRRSSSTLLIIIFSVLVNISLSCTGKEKINRKEEINTSSGQYTVYIVNNSIHTGIVIPVDSESLLIISALQYFKDLQFADFGWGEEVAYQDPDENYFHDVKAVLFPNSSVICVEGYRSIADSLILWSDFTVKLTLSTEQFIKLIDFIDKSFKKEPGNELIITSKRRSGEAVFFKSVLKYHLFNTCNTWIAKALESTGLDVSPFFIITAGQLYREIKDQGTVLKSLK